MSIFHSIFPRPIPFVTLEELNARPNNDECNRQTKTMYEQALSDFTRVGEETGILDQKETPLTKRASDHD